MFLSFDDFIIENKKLIIESSVEAGISSWPLDIKNPNDAKFLNLLKKYNIKGKEIKGEYDSNQYPLVKFTGKLDSLKKVFTSDLGFSEDELVFKESNIVESKDEDMISWLPTLNDYLVFADKKQKDSVYKVLVKCLKMDKSKIKAWVYTDDESLLNNGALSDALIDEIDKQLDKNWKKLKDEFLKIGWDEDDFQLMYESNHLNEKTSFKNIQNIVFDSFDEMELLINNNILDPLFIKYPDTTNQIKDIKKSLYTLMDEIIDTWHDTSNK